MKLAHIALWTRDLDAAAAFWQTYFGATVDESYRSQRRPGFVSRFAALPGGVQIELIQQHCDRPSAYRDTIAKGAQGFHHFCIYTDDYDACRQRYVDQGFAVAIDGKFGAMRFCYVLPVVHRIYNRFDGTIFKVWHGKLTHFLG